MAKQRITEDFVRHFRLVKERTGNSPFNIARALDRNPDLGVSIRELYRLWRIIEQHRLTSKRRVILQTHPDFPAALNDYRERWQSAWMDLEDWEDRKAGRETFGDWIDRALNKVEASSSTDSDPVDDEWDFDPDEHSAASLVEQISDYIDFKAEDSAFFSRAKGALIWIRDTLGLDLRETECRFKEFPVIVIPEHVSNRHGPDDPRSLFAYLNDVRLAYIIGANLAAIAMCRACTEILIRIHYNRDDRTDLTPLIKSTLTRRDFAHLKAHNLVAKVREANDLLHFNAQNIATKERERTLVRDWVRSLEEMIARAPRR